jgi:hypothetical protein
MLGVILISLALLAISGLLIDSHRRTWHHARDSAELSDRDRRFAQSMYRRRMLASGMIGGIGAGIGVGPIVPREPLAMAFYLATLLAACAWIMLLAMLDTWATRRHYRRVRREQLSKQLQLTVEMASLGETAESEGPS